MDNPRSDLLSIEFLPLSEVKAKLSEQIKKTQNARRVAVTTNGRPTAVLLSYRDFLGLLKSAQISMDGSQTGQPGRILSYDQWKQEGRHRETVRDSILNLFDMKKLSRKGQKSYKKDLVREFERRNKTTTEKGGKDRRSR